MSLEREFQLLMQRLEFDGTERRECRVVLKNVSSKPLVLWAALISSSVTFNQAPSIAARGQCVARRVSVRFTLYAGVPNYTVW